jgi:methyl-accepting chemotaxis protein
VTRYLGFALRHPYLVAALVVLLFLPWLWMVFLVPEIPRWVFFTAIGLAPIAALTAIALVMKDVNREEEEPAPDDAPFLKWRKRTRLFQQVVVGLDTMLERWDGVAQPGAKKLEAAAQGVAEVIGLTESAVADISKSFRVVVAKATEQTEAATALLTRDDSGRGKGVLSLPEFIQAYDSQLVNVTTHMTSFSQAADELANIQKRVTEHAHVMEQTIDGLRNMASQIARIALDGSVAMTSATFSARDFVEMTDRIRAISAEAHELTRKTRTGLDAIGEEVRQGNKRTMQVAEAARRAVDTARNEISTLNAATIEQTRQVETTLTHVNDLSVEIQKDINQIIVAMQFQDITRQKLERHRPILAATAEALGKLAHESQALRHRDLYRAVLAYAHSAIKPTREQLESTGRKLDDASVEVAPPSEPLPDPEKKVEIF